MINMPQEINYQNTAILGGDLVNQIICLYNEDPELAKEMAFAAIIYTATGAKKIVSDNLIIKMSLLGSKTFIEKSTSKYIEKQGNIEAKEIKDKRLNEIAPLLAQKLSQAEISRRLGIPRSTMADRCKIIRNKYPHLLEAPSGQIPFSNPDDSDKSPMEEQMNLSTPTTNVRDVRKNQMSGSDSRNPDGFSDEFAAQDNYHHKNYDIVLSECPENPENPDVRTNKNKNQNQNKNKNISNHPGQKVPDDKKVIENVRTNPDESREQKIRKHPDKIDDDNRPDKSFEVYEQKIRIHPDENRANKKSGQISENVVIKNPDISGQKDDDKNEPMTAEQIQWLRARGYSV